jgi:hypothetical protein
MRKHHLLLGDFRRLFSSLKPNSIDAIITDPPYTARGTAGDLWEELARESERVLKPGGWFVTYTGHMFLPKILPAMCRHLDYFWTLNVLFHRGYVQQHTGMLTRSNPIAVFYKPPRKPLLVPVPDVIIGGGREKEFHEWQKPEREVAELIELWTLPNQWILDPCCGSATTLLAACKSGRKSIGFEINPGTYQKAGRRLIQAGVLPKPDPEHFLGQFHSGLRKKEVA